MSGSGREAFPDVREWSRISLGSSGVVGRPSRLSGNGPETLPDVREPLPDGREWSGASLGSTEVVGRPSWMSGSSCETRPDIRELSRVPLESPGVDRRSSQMSGSCQVALPVV